ncbi:MAG TPA: VC0807 family protein [Opitutaceae bacterium]|nr:VC0807 family protein [Opitutaceae bacterium]
MPDPVRPPRENILLNLACNVAVPVFLLTKGQKLLGLDPKVALLIALAFPLGYGVADFVRRRNFNVLSALGFASTLATGGLSLLQLEPFWFAVKEASVPLLIALAVLLTRHSKSSILRAMMLNEEVVNLPRINEALQARRREADFERLLDSTNWLIIGSFIFSAVLNFALARMIITTTAADPEFNLQLGKLTGLSYIVIAVPSIGISVFALWRMFRRLSGLTGLGLEELLHAPEEKK